MLKPSDSVSSNIETYFGGVEVTSGPDGPILAIADELERLKANE
jgi:hypothetical protein